MAAVNLVVIAAAVVVLAVALAAWNLYRTSDWYRLRQVRKGLSVHLPTDPACRLYTADPPRRSRLYAAARGWPCPICDAARTEDSPW